MDTPYLSYVVWFVPVAKYSEWNAPGIVLYVVWPTWPISVIPYVVWIVVVVCVVVVGWNCVWVMVGFKINAFVSIVPGRTWVVPNKLLGSVAVVPSAALVAYVSLKN